MSRLAERRARVARSCDRAHGEPCRIVPLLTGGAVIGAAHPTIPPYEVVGIFNAASALQDMKGHGSNAGERVTARGTRAVVSISRAALGGNPQPETGWHVLLLDRPGQPAYRILPGEPGQAERTSYPLVPLGAPAK